MQKDNDYKFRVMGVIMREKFDKYWGAIEKMNLSVYFAAVLDPRMKLFFVRYAFKTLLGYERDPENKDDKTFEDMVDKKVKEEVEDKMTLVYEEYKLMYEIPVSNATTHREGIVEEVVNVKSKSKFRAMFEKEGGSNASQSKSELQKYLEEPREELDDDFDILQWWKVNAGRYPIVSKMSKGNQANQQSLCYYVNC